MSERADRLTVAVPRTFLAWLVGVLGSAVLTAGICLAATEAWSLAPLLIYLGAMLVALPPIPMLV